MEMWMVDSNILQNRRDCLRQLMKTFVPLILQVVLHEFRSVMPISTIGLVENLCRLLDALVTSENIPKYVEDESKYIEKYFVFAAIWAFAWAVRSGQFDDLDTPPLDILAEDPREPRTPPRHEP